MPQLDIILMLMALLAAIYCIADWIKVSYPILLVLAGLGIGLVPGLPVVQLSPDVVFLIFLPPLLFEAARNTSWRDFRKNRRPISRLAIGLVFFTTASIAICAHYIIPGFSWPLAFLLGAIVSPPDVVAATSATKGLGLPKRIISILEGESLINDASALIAYRYALGAVLSGVFVFWQAGLQFILVAAGGIAAGIAVGFVFAFVQKRVLNNPTVETIVTLMVPFVSYLTAEHLHASGVLAVVTTGLYVSWNTQNLFSFETRVKMNSFWETLVFLLNGFVFILIGLQLPAIFSHVSDYTLPALIGYGLMISVLTILARIIWIFPSVHLSNLMDKITKGEKGTVNSSYLLVIGWAGMRGVVSLAAALSLPLTLNNGDPFPQRDAILLITFIVILVTLVFQGLTLPALVRFLNVKEPDGMDEAEENALRLDIANRTIAYIDGMLTDEYHSDILGELKRRIGRQINHLTGEDQLLMDSVLAQNISAHEELRQILHSELAIVQHQRNQVAEMQKDGIYSTTVLNRLEQELDIWSLSLDARLKGLKERP